MPIPEEFIKKETEVTISRATLQDVKCRSCGARIDPKNIQNGFARCAYCLSVFALSVDGKFTSQ
jgi:hypothetical protein